MRRFKWTPAVLVGLAAMMYIPKMMWDAFEGGKLNSIVTSEEVAFRASRVR